MRLDHITPKYSGLCPDPVKMGVGKRHCEYQRVLIKPTLKTGSLTPFHTSLPGGKRALEPPDPIPNSEVKRCIADGSVGLPHVRVGHCRASNPKPLSAKAARGFFCLFYRINL